MTSHQSLPQRHSFRLGHSPARRFRCLEDRCLFCSSLHPTNCSTDLPVVLSVDTSYIAIGFILSQYDESGHKRPARYGSLPINEHESRYSQPKLELYGLFRALRHYRLFLYGVKNLHIEVDAKYIKGVLNDPCYVIVPQSVSRD